VKILTTLSFIFEIFNIHTVSVAFEKRKNCEEKERQGYVNRRGSSDYYVANIVQLLKKKREIM